MRVHGVLVRPAHVLNRGEINMDLDLVILEGNKRESKTGVAAVEELKRDIERVSRGTAANLRSLRRVRVTGGGTGIVAISSSGIEGVYELGHVTYHASVTALLAGGKRKLVPDVHPVAILLINLLTSNLELDLLDKVVAGPVEPAERSIAEIGRGELVRKLDLRKRSLNIRLPDEITVAGNLASNISATEIGRTSKGLLDRLNREVGMPAVVYLEEGNLRVTRDIHILSAISYKLHKTATHFKLLYHIVKIFLKNAFLGCFRGSFI
jgi:hypothetical protein